MPRATKSPKAANRATDRPGDSSPFAMGLLLRRAHNRATTELVAAMRPFGLELRHFAMLIILVNQGSTLQRDFVDVAGFDVSVRMNPVQSDVGLGIAVGPAVEPARAGFEDQRPNAYSRR